MYYVYEWFIVETGEIIYVGKGTKRRYKVTKHNKLFNEMIKRFTCNSRIIKEFENEEDAFYYEYIHIEELKKIGQCVCNINIGGIGGTTSWWTDERRKEYSENNVMKSVEQRQRMSKNNPMKNSETAKKVSEQNTKHVIINDIEYNSCKEAAEKLNICYPTLKKWCEKGINNKGEICYYKGQKPKQHCEGYYKPKGKAIIYNGVKYNSAKDCAIAIGVSLSCVCGWAKKGFTPSGIPCKYENDTTEYTYTPIKRGKQSYKAIKVNGVLYVSIKDAERKLGLSNGYLAPYLAGTRKNTKYICEYVNQQPSLENSDNSIKEGSTTNR